MSTTTIASIFSGGVVSISEILYTGFVLMVPIAAGLIGFGILVKYVFMWIGSPDTYIVSVDNDYAFDAYNKRTGKREMHMRDEWDDFTRTHKVEYDQ